ncbi:MULTISPECIES: multidrug ABC transporter ATPase [Microbacterium]|uniref:Multidrug ABC transporter ATPase n=1 Tax=Microbacterium algihabitans TaxID=3075992 RepID=A0ABU3RZ55_9MICO|nr:MULTISPECIES: multidrug ABC transporter ATPase [Microbacterium]MCD2171161.1 multidrug ABC transporter ATPase [Microbacterium sp. JC 701]MDU0328166.1 multidrug ABC transporter ATPase [Microbacterium sp. KSW2-21]
MSTRTSGGSTPGDDIPVRRIDRILTFMSLGLVVVSIVCFFIVILAQPLGVSDFTQGAWPLIVVLPLFALPVGFALIIALLIMNFVRKGRANRAR